MLFYYCGNTDGYPHWRFKLYPEYSECYNSILHEVHDRDFWSDATSNYIILDYYRTH